MKLIEFGSKKLAIQYNTKVIKEMNKEGITFKTLGDDMQDSFDTTKLYDAFYFGVKNMNAIKYEDIDDVIDEYFNSGNSIEDLFELVITEMSEAMGFSKQLKKAMKKETKKQSK